MPMSCAWLCLGSAASATIVRGTALGNILISLCHIIVLGAWPGCVRNLDDNNDELRPAVALCGPRPDTVSLCRIVVRGVLTVRVRNVDGSTDDLRPAVFLPVPRLSTIVP